MFSHSPLLDSHSSQSSMSSHSEISSASDSEGYIAIKSFSSFLKSVCSLSNFLVSETEKNSYLRSIKELVKKIKQKKLLKIVFSKKFSFKYPESNCLKTFKKILDSYDDAFCYMFFHPDEGYWVGASP